MASNSGAVAQSVPTSVPRSTKVKVDDEPQLGPYVPASGNSVVTPVPNSGEPGDAPAQPGYGRVATTGAMPDSGSPGAPSVPALGGALFRAPAVDDHYQDPYETGNPYAKVNNPPTRGMLTWVKSYANHVFNGAQNVDSAGHQQNSEQQRTSYMRITPPPHGNGYDPQPSTPHQLPQTAYTQRFLPTTGSDPYGSGVLNADNYGAGQVAVGEGGQQYTPTPGPPATTVAGAAGDTSGMPSWG